MKPVVFDLDDLCDQWDPWDKLHEMKAKWPGLKVTLFAIPGMSSDELLAKYAALDWVELGVHGYHHSTQECMVWPYDEAVAKLREMDKKWPGVRLFKAPGWMMNQPVAKALSDEGWSVADHRAYAWVSGRMRLNRYTYNLPGQLVQPIHGHTWDTMGNGPSQWDAMFAEVPKDAEFKTVLEVCELIDWGYDVGDEQEDNTSWNHLSAFGKEAIKRLVEFLDEVKPTGLCADFGGNDGTAALAARQAGYDVMVVDGSPAKTHFAHTVAQVPTMCVDLLRMPLRDDVFEWGFCSHTLEHIPDMERAWSEMKRLCSKGIYVVLPVESQEKFESNPAHFHYNTAEGWCELLGLELVETPANEVIGVWRR